MLRKLLICGLLAGLCGGLAAAGLAALAGEGAIDRAIAYQRAAAPAGEPAAAAPVSRALQRGIGLVVAAAVYGVALGGLFALAFAAAYGRVGRAGPRVTAYALAAAAFAVVYLVPFVKYPANPPGATDPSTIGRRTGLYLTMLAISLLAALAAARLRPLLARRLDGHAASLAAGLAFLAVVVAAGLALPSAGEPPPDFPAATLWRFREASVGMQAILWLTIGLVFASAARRAMAGRPILRWRAGDDAGAVRS